METIGPAIQRLLMDESLTADVDDAAAKALLRWGEEQIKAGRPEAQVRRGIRTLGQLVAKRAALDPTAARERLEAAGLAAAEAALAPLWAESLPEGEWAGRLLQALTPSAPLLVPSPASVPPGDQGKETRGQRDRGTWWRRLLFWRKPG